RFHQTIVGGREIGGDLLGVLGAFLGFEAIGGGGPRKNHGSGGGMVEHQQIGVGLVHRVSAETFAEHVVVRAGDRFQCGGQGAAQAVLFQNDLVLYIFYDLQ